jgi:peptide/nickel transport system ATP-binding protein
MAILELIDLKTWFTTRSGVVKAVDGVSLELGAGQILGLVGESGSGKSVTGYSILRLIDPPGKIVAGKIMFEGRDLLTLSEREMQRVRGSRISMIPQDPMAALNPVLTIGAQMTETILAHESVSPKDAWARARDALGVVGIPSPAERLSAYPHQLSGGMRQRVVIAIAMLNRPAVIIADEPTTGLDVTIQGQILNEVQRLCRETRTALIWITHDLSVVSALAESLCVMYAGTLVESGPIQEVLQSPLHPYTEGLLACVPSRNVPGQSLPQIPGAMPSSANFPTGCAFRGRCNYEIAECRQPVELRHIQAGRQARCIRPLLREFV